MPDALTPEREREIREWLAADQLSWNAKAATTDLLAALAHERAARLAAEGERDAERQKHHENSARWTETTLAMAQDLNTLTAERDRLAALVLRLWDHFITEEHGDLEQFDFMEWIAAAGLVDQAPYDPDKHGDAAFDPEPGDIISFLKPWLAALRAPQAGGAG